MNGTMELRQQVESLNWVHTIDLGDGIVTPGLWKPSPVIMRCMDQVDFQGKRVLDIGCWDGLWSFEAERRGAAEVIATDENSQRLFNEQPTFKLAHQVLQSSVKYFPDVSVYDVEKLDRKDFDVILFCGVYYHLKDPLLALARLRRLLKPGGVILVEGEVIHDLVNSYGRFYYHEQYVKDPSNWWVPTVACLREWVECTYLEIKHEENLLPLQSLPVPGLYRRMKSAVKVMLNYPTPPPVFSRHCLVAQAVERDDKGYMYPDDLLSAFNR